VPDDREVERAFNLLRDVDLRGSPPAQLGGDLGMVSGPPSSGDLLGKRYRLLGSLGEGGMGTVFRGQDESLGRRPVAIKFLALEGEAAQKRFAREAEVTSRIRHPHVIGIHAAGEFRGQHYLVYELIEGARSLGDGFEEVSLDERLDLIEQVASGLSAAHALGIIHRDLKPENVLIHPSVGAVVADFGLAGLDASSLTNTGQTLGTPAYMSPEQVRGDRPTPACDVWALGLLLYEAVYQEHPFLREGITIHHLLAQIYNAQIDFPVGPAQPLRALLKRVLVAEPAARPADAAEFLESLREARRARPSRLPWVALGAGLTCVVVLAGAGALRLPAQPSESPGASASPSQLVATSPSVSHAPSQTPSTETSESAPTPSPAPPLATRSTALPEPEIRFSLEETNGDSRLHFLSETELLAVWKDRAQRRTVEGEPRGEPWTLPTFDGECLVATHGLEVAVASKRQVWTFQLPSKEPKTLPPLPFEARYLRLFGSGGRTYLLATSKKQAVCGVLGGTLSQLDVKGEVEATSAGGGRAALLTKGGGLAPRRILVFEAQGAGVLDWIHGGLSTPVSLALSPTGDRAFLGLRHGQLSLRSGPSQDKDSQELGRSHELGSVRAVAWSRSGGRLAAVSKETLSVWDVDRPAIPIYYGELPSGGKGDDVVLSPAGGVVFVTRNASHLGWRLPRR
jgi:serine/threonine protein kinase